MKPLKQRQHELDMQAVAKQAEADVGLGKKTESEILAMSAWAKMVFLPFEAGLLHEAVFIVPDILLKALMDNTANIRQSDDVAQKAKLQTGQKINFRDNTRQKINFRASGESGSKTKSQMTRIDRNKINFRLSQPAANLTTRPLNKQDVQGVRAESLKPTDFPDQMRLRPQGDIFKDTRLAQAEGLVKNDKNKRKKQDQPDLTPVYAMPKQPQPQPRYSM